MILLGVRTNFEVFSDWRGQVHRWRPARTLSLVRDVMQQETREAPMTIHWSPPARAGECAVGPEVEKARLNAHASATEGCET